MKVLIYKWKVYNYPAITAAFESMGHRTKTIEYDTDSGESRQAVVEGFADEINDFTPDIVFTVNYFGELSDACQTCGIPYISWTCDSPLIAMYHESVFNDVNFIFIFDKVQYYYFKNAGVRHVYYLPLAADELMAARAEDIERDLSRRYRLWEASMRRIPMTELKTGLHLTLKGILTLQ